MLRRSRGCQMGQAYLRGVFESTIGVIFFGTPHAGSDPRNFLHRIAEEAIKAAGFSVNQQIVNALLPSSERLRELRDEFGPMALDRDWTIHSFQEDVGIQGLFGRKVVDDVSSCLNISAVETTEHIGRNHMEMCRFIGPNDTEYEKVAAALRRITMKVFNQPTSMQRPLLDEEQKKKLLDSLRFDQVDARQMTIKNAHAKTCEWLLEKSEYRDWLDHSKLDEHCGFLWIKGKPGTGKSILMKYAMTNTRTKKPDTIIISFFFNARGTELEKSTAGMYQSLLLQLLEQFPALQDIFNSLIPLPRNDGYYQWSVESLKSLFEQAVQSLGASPLICFIDALDECNETQIRDMVSFFKQLSQQTTSTGIQFRICYASRHYPHITMGKGLSFILEGQDGHTRDIIHYINNKLDIGRSKLAETIRVELQEKAAGVFIWVALVVEILNKEHDGGRIHTLQQRLRDIPGDLHELFRDILTRDKFHRGELLLCIQWILFARQPVKPKQLYFAILSGIGPDALSDCDPEEITTAVIQRFILDASKGLAEFTKSKDPTVQFIHESVRDFLLKDNGFQRIWPDLGSNFEGESQERLKQCCLSQLHIDIATPLGISSSLPKAYSLEAIELRQLADKKFPLLEYATQNILYHADAAEAGGVSQASFLHSFERVNWIKSKNLFERDQARRYTSKASLLYLLAERNAAALIRIHPSNKACFSVEDERYGVPMFAALATRSKDAAAALVEAHSILHPHISLLQHLRYSFVENRNRCLNIGSNFTFLKRDGVFSVVSDQQDEAFGALFAIVSDTNAKVNIGRTSLLWAASYGSETILQLLLDRGADLETSLLWAVRYGSESIVQLLLDRGADLEVKDNMGQTPLSWAAKYGSEAIVQLLLDRGADLEVKDNMDQTLLLWTARFGSEAIVQLLLDRGAGLDAQDNVGRTQLSWAAKSEYKAVAQLLLDRGAELEAKDRSG
ncbi:ankyrin [Thozetella sp. PMI_491]|nr:ankyrin [Thozetella sp. PMI_491]